jgi:hypothetical protein
MPQLRFVDSGHIDTEAFLKNTNQNLDTLSKQKERAKTLGDEVMVDYFEELRDITLDRFKEYMLTERPDTFVKERGEFFYSNR